MDRVQRSSAGAVRANHVGGADTGIPLEWERALSAAFISTAGYGTRCSTLLMRAAGHSVLFAERRFTTSVANWEESRFSWAAPDVYLTD